MNEATDDTDLSEEVARSGLLGVAETDVNNWEFLNVHIRVMSDSLIISILHLIIIVLKEPSWSPEEVHQILSQSYMGPFSSNGIQSETLSGRLEREWKDIIFIGVEIDLLCDYIGHKNFIFEPVNDIVFICTAIVLTFAPFYTKLEFGLLMAWNLGLV